MKVLVHRMLALGLLAHKPTDAEIHVKTANQPMGRLWCLTWILATLLLLIVPGVVQAQFIFTTNNGAITITAYTGPGGPVVIPSSTNGYPVIGIGFYAFGGSSLTSVTIPNTVTNIGDEAFRYCTSLTIVRIPSNVTSIGAGAFTWCTSLWAIIVEPGNSVYCDVDGVLFDRNQTTLIAYPGGIAGSYAIPATVTIIGDFAFTGSTLTSATIPSSVTSIGSSAFYDCSNLVYVAIPNSVTNIGDWAFVQCASLTSVTIPNSVTRVGVYTFYYCTGLTNATIGNSVASIGEYAFSVCTSLTSVTIPSSVTSIEDEAFYYCTSLTNATIGNGVTSIGDGAFAACTSLTSVTIPNSVASIGHYAFYNCSNLTGVYFRGNAPSVGANVFAGDTDATVYYLPGTTSWGATYAGLPTALWQPQIQTDGTSFGVRTNQLGFNVAWASGMVIVVEACTNLANPFWSPLRTNTLTGNSFYFSDPAWTNYSRRFYRIRSPLTFTLVDWLKPGLVWSPLQQWNSTVF